MKFTLAECTANQALMSQLTQKPASVNTFRSGVGGAVLTKVGPVGMEERESDDLRRGFKGRAAPQRGSRRPSTTLLPVRPRHVPRRQCNGSALQSKSAGQAKVRALIDRSRTRSGRALTEVRFRFAGLIQTGKVRGCRFGDFQYIRQNMLAKLHGEVAE